MESVCPVIDLDKYEFKNKEAAYMDDLEMLDVEIIDYGISEDEEDEVEEISRVQNNDLKPALVKEETQIEDSVDKCDFRRSHKLKPVSVKLVDCNKFPWYYPKYKKQILMHKYADALSNVREIVEQFKRAVNGEHVTDSERCCDKSSSVTSHDIQSSATETMQKEIRNEEIMNEPVEKVRLIEKIVKQKQNDTELRTTNTEYYENINDIYKESGENNEHSFDTTFLSKDKLKGKYTLKCSLKITSPKIIMKLKKHKLPKNGMTAAVGNVRKEIKNTKVIQNGGITNKPMPKSKKAEWERYELSRCKEKIPPKSNHGYNKTTNELPEDVNQLTLKNSDQTKGFFNINNIEKSVLHKSPNGPMDENKIGEQTIEINDSSEQNAKQTYTKKQTSELEPNILNEKTKNLNLDLTRGVIVEKAFNYFNMISKINTSPVTSTENESLNKQGRNDLDLAVSSNGLYQTTKECNATSTHITKLNGIYNGKQNMPIFEENILNRTSNENELYSVTKSKDESENITPKMTLSPMVVSSFVPDVRAPQDRIIAINNPRDIQPELCNINRPVTDAATQNITPVHRSQNLSCISACQNNGIQNCLGSSVRNESSPQNSAFHDMSIKNTQINFHGITSPYRTINKTSVRPIVQTQPVNQRLTHLLGPAKSTIFLPFKSIQPQHKIRPSLRFLRPLQRIQHHMLNNRPPNQQYMWNQHINKSLHTREYTQHYSPGYKPRGPPGICNIYPNFNNPVCSSEVPTIEKNTNCNNFIPVRMTEHTGGLAKKVNKATPDIALQSHKGTKPIEAMAIDVANIPLPETEVSKPFQDVNKHGSDLKMLSPDNITNGITKNSPAKDGPLPKRPKYSNLVTIPRTEQNVQPDSGYSPPILPIPTFLTALSELEVDLDDSSMNTDNAEKPFLLPGKPVKGILRKTSEKADSARRENKEAYKKISLEQYKKREIK